MSVTVLVVISILLVIGLLYILYSIKVAEVQDDLLDEEFDEKAFSKPEGWKVGTMPKELQNAKKIARIERASETPSRRLEDIVSKWKREELPKLDKPE